jgi:hypothetical protein
MGGVYVKNGDKATGNWNASIKRLMMGLHLAHTFNLIPVGFTFLYGRGTQGVDEVKA